MQARKYALFSSSSAIVLSIFSFSASSFLSFDAYAACSASGSTTTCNTDSPNPWTSRIGAGRGDNGKTVNFQSGSTISVGNTNAISLGDGANITIGSGASVTNATAQSGSTGGYGTGPNTIEFGSNGTLVVQQGGSVIETGTHRSAEAINVHGPGNTIINRGLIQANSSAAIWFQDEISGAKNVVDNYGTIEKLGGSGSVIGTSGGSGINFTNRTGAKVIGGLSFAGGNDTLTFEPGSSVSGDINGGGGTNDLFLQGVSGSSDTLAGALRNFTTLTKQGEGLWTVTGSLTGFTTVTVKDGTLALTGNNSGYTGNVIVEPDGVLEARAQSLPTKTNPADNVSNVQNDGLVRFTQPDDGTYIGQIIGSGAVEKTGGGVLTLAPVAPGGNTYAGGTTIRDGTIAVGADNVLGAATGALTFDGGALRFDQSFDLAGSRAVTLDAGGGTIDTNGNTTSITQNITGIGALTKAGAGVLNLEGDNSYAGNTTVSGGELYVNGNQSAATGATSVQSGATVGGVGTIGGDLTIADGATLAPGRPDTIPGTLTVNGNLNLNSGSSLDYNFGQANVVGGALNDHTIVGGDLVLDGTINVQTTPGGSFDPGVYRVISYSGSLTNNGLEIGQIPASGFYVQTSVDKQVNLVNTSGLTLNYWDGAAGPKKDGTVNGGDGVWQNFNGNDNWTTIDGTPNAPFADSSFAIFMAKKGDVTVDNSLGDVRVSGMQFASDGYVVHGEAITLVGNPSTTVRVGDGTAEGASFTATINSELTGDSRLVKSDLGTLVLGAANTYTGGTSINGGTVQISSNENLGGAAGDVSMNGGTLRTTANMDIDRATELQGLGGTIETDGGTTLDYTAAITGDGSLTKTGDGTLVLNTQSTYTGATSVETGTFAAGGENVFSNTSDFTVSQGGTLALRDFDQTVKSLANAGLVDLGPQPGTTLMVSGNYTGNGGTVTIGTVLGDDASLTDRMVVAGDTSGTSVLAVKNVDGSGAPTNEGIKVVDVGGASNGTFTLLGDYEFQGRQAVVGGAYAYQLYKNGKSTPTDGDWYLRSELLDPADPDSPERPLYQPGVPSYEAYPQALLGLNGLPTLQQRVGNRYWAGNGNRVIAQGADPVGSPYAAPDEAGTAIGGNGVWGRIEGAHNSMEPRFSTSGTTYDENILKLQAGLDGLLAETENGKLIGGITLHYVHGKTKTDSVYGDGEISTNGYGFGGTLTWYGDNGFYIDGQGQVTWYRSDLDSQLAGSKLVNGNDGFGYTLSIESGKRIALNPGWSLTPQAQLVYSNVDFDDFTDVFGARVSLGRGDSLQGRLGLTLDHENSWQNANGMLNRTHVYGIANLYYEFLDGTRVDVAGTSFASRNDRLWGGLGIGGSYNWNDDKYSIYGEGLVNTSFNNFGDSYSVKGQIGFRVKW